MAVSTSKAEGPRRQFQFGPKNRVVRRTLSALVRSLGGVSVGALAGVGVQLVTGVNGWALFGAAAGLVSVTFFLGLRDPRR